MEQSRERTRDTAVWFDGCTMVLRKTCARTKSKPRRLQAPGRMGAGTTDRGRCASSPAMPDTAATQLSAHEVASNGQGPPPSQQQQGRAVHPAAAGLVPRQGGCGAAAALDGIETAQRVRRLLLQGRGQGWTGTPFGRVPMKPHLFDPLLSSTNSLRPIWRKN